jgi:hypothetical protein
MKEWVRLRVGSRDQYEALTWHLRSNDGSTLCGFVIGEGRAITGRPTKFEKRCVLCSVLERTKPQAKEKTR